MSSIFTPELTAALVAHNRLYDVKEFAKAADALLAEGLALLRAHAGEGDVINRYVATVEKVRAQYRAAKEAPAPAPDVSPPGFRIVGRSGPGVPMPTDPNQWVLFSRFRGDPGDTGNAPTQWRHRGDQQRGLWNAGCYDILEPIPAPAPEPSAPPAGVPVCPRGFAWCGQIDWGNCNEAGCIPSHGRHWCSPDCVGRPLNPPPSDPVTVATRERPSHCQCPYHECAGKLENPDHELCEWCSRKRADECVTVATGGDECPGCDEHCEDEKCPAAHGPCVDEPVATVAVPTGYRLGDGWEVVGGVTDWGCSQEIDSDHCNATPAFVGPAEDSSHPAWQAGACAAHAVEMGALVPIAPARSVPPGPVRDSIDALWYAAHGAPIGPEPVKAGPSETLSDLLRWQPTAAEVQAAYKPAAPASEPRPGGGVRATVPASEPAVRPLSGACECGSDECCTACEPENVEAWKERAAALEAELAEAKGDVDQMRVQLAGVSVAALGGTSEPVIAHRGQWGWSVAYQDTLYLRLRYDAARAEVEQLRGMVVSMSNDVLRLTNVVAHHGMEVADAQADAIKAAPHVCKCSNGPCPRCGGTGPEGEWFEGSEVECADCGAPLIVATAEPCHGSSTFEAIDEEPDEEDDESGGYAPGAVTP